jgi:hypothetical protein
MDVAPLVAYLAPFLPYLLKAGKKFTAGAVGPVETQSGSQTCRP